MMKNTIRLAVALAILTLPLQAALAAPAIPDDQIAATVRPFAKLNKSIFVKASAKKTYTVKKQFTVALPSTWKKLTPSTGYVFSAQLVNNADTALTISVLKYSTQKQATTANNVLRKTPNKYGQVVLEQLQKQFPDQNCTLRNTGKKTLGTNAGARANVICGPAGEQIIFSVFSFIRKLSYYGVLYVIPTSQFSKLIPSFDTVTASIKFL